MYLFPLPSNLRNGHNKKWALQLRPPPVLVPLLFGLALDLPSMVLALYLDRFEDDKQSTTSTGV